MGSTLRSMAFFTALGAALLTGAWASTLLPQDTPSQTAADHKPARVHPPLQLSWAPSWLMTVINNAMADTFERDKHS